MHRVRSFKATRRQSKYANIPDDYKGNKYHSKFEAKYARDLDLRLGAGEIASWDRQINIRLRGVGGSHICIYKIDFVVMHTDGVKEYVEVKGFETDVWRLKWKLFEDQMGVDEPDALLTIVRK
jgi:hypothetical protein